MPIFTETLSFQIGGESVKTQQISVSAPNLISEDVNFSSSGQLVQLTSGVVLPPSSKLAALGISFPGVSGPSAQLYTWWSGSMSGAGGVIDNLLFPAGQQELTWVCSGPDVHPLRPLSGTVYGLSIQCTSLLSGQTSSGNVRLLYQN